MQKWSNRPLRPINSNPLPADPELSITLTAKPYIATTSRYYYYRNRLKVIKVTGEKSWKENLVTFNVTRQNVSSFYGTTSKMTTAYMKAVTFRELQHDNCQSRT